MSMPATEVTTAERIKMKKRSFYYKVIRLMVTPFETIINDERHFPDVNSARAYARSTPDNLKAVIFRLQRDGIIII